MTIEQGISKVHAGSTHITCGNWRVEREESDPFVGQEFTLWHHGTLMLRWRKSVRAGIEPLYMSLGYGSVSDQGGMNRAFRHLNLPYRYTRRGGADITEEP